MKKGKLIICNENGGTAKEITFMFNPESYTISSNAHYKENSEIGKEGSNPEFLKGTTRTLTTSLFFDSYYEHMPSAAPMSLLGGFMSFSSLAESKIKPVTDTTKKIQEAVMIAGSQHKPPMVKFQWGNLNFQGVIQNLSEEYTMFTSSGKPTRAKVNITIDEVVDSKAGKLKSPFESPDRTKSKVVIEGMSLWSLAAEEYNDAEKWRIIAKANHIMNPLDIYPGQVLSIPALDNEVR